VNVIYAIPKVTAATNLSKKGTCHTQSCNAPCPRKVSIRTPAEVVDVFQSKKKNDLTKLS
jgi:predicted aldo/keto reductase-like oxidoreductase